MIQSMQKRSIDSEVTALHSNDSNPNAILTNSIKQNQKPLQFSASDLAAITGFHPYANPLELFDKYLYQNIELLREVDMKVLGVDFITADQEIALILEKLDRFIELKIEEVETSQSMQTKLDLTVEQLRVTREKILQDLSTTNPTVASI